MGRRGARPTTAHAGSTTLAGVELARRADGVAKTGSKQALLIEQLSGPAGARIGDLVNSLGWQAHTVRAALTRLRQQGHAIARSKDEQGETVYRLGSPQPAPGSAPGQKAA